MIYNEQIFPIGIGTFRIDLSNKEQATEALLYSLSRGQNYFDVSSMYEDGKVMTFIGEFLSTVDRNKVFISCKISNDINCTEDIAHYLDKYLKMLQLDYVDCLEFHAPKFCKISLLEAYHEMKKMVDKGLVRYLGISNCTFEQLIELNDNVGIDIFDGVYNLECKTYENNRVLEYCYNHNIKFVCYQPLRRNRTAKRNYPLLVNLAKKYNKTQNQIILNWIIKEKRISPIIKSTSIERIDENNDSLNFEMSGVDMEKLNSFKAEEFDNVIIDWEENGGITIDQLPNQFN
jgi:diketogulonate reductase-like aldo/keto reductase